MNAVARRLSREQPSFTETAGKGIKGVSVKAVEHKSKDLKAKRKSAGGNIVCVQSK